MHKLRKTNAKLAAAIKKGQDEKQKSGTFAVALAKFKSFNAEQMQEITDITFKGGLEALAEQYGYSTFIINKCRKAYPKMEEAIKTGFDKKSTKPYKKRYNSGTACLATTS